MPSKPQYGFKGLATILTLKILNQASEIKVCLQLTWTLKCHCGLVLGATAFLSTFLESSCDALKAYIYQPYRPLSNFFMTPTLAKISPKFGIFWHFFAFSAFFWHFEENLGESGIKNRYEQIVVISSRAYCPYKPHQKCFLIKQFW